MTVMTTFDFGLAIRYRISDVGERGDRKRQDEALVADVLELRRLVLALMLSTSLAGYRVRASGNTQCSHSRAVTGRIRPEYGFCPMSWAQGAMKLQCKELPDGLPLPSHYDALARLGVIVLWLFTDYISAHSTAGSGRCWAWCSCPGQR